MANGGRCRQVETVLDEMEATRRALDLGRPGDVIAICADRPNEVWKELQRRQHGAASAAGAGVSVPAMTLDVANLADLGSAADGDGVSDQTPPA
jgi:cyanophycin synthetase